MDVTATYCLADDFLLGLGRREPPERAVSDAEVLTVALVAARTYDGNFEAAWRFLLGHGYMARRLSRGRFNRRLYDVLPLAEQLFRWLGEIWKRTGDEGVFPSTRCSFACCDNARIPRSKLYPLGATGGAFRGFQSSKRRFFYGVRAHVVVNEHGLPVEFHLAPGSYNDTAELKNLALDGGLGRLWGQGVRPGLRDRGRARRGRGGHAGRPAQLEATDPGVRELRAGALPQADRDGVQRGRGMLPKSIHAVTARGFETKVFLFLLALSLDGLM